MCVGDMYMVGGMCVEVVSGAMCLYVSECGDVCVLYGVYVWVGVYRIVGVFVFGSY